MLRFKSIYYKMLKTINLKHDNLNDLILFMEKKLQTKTFKKYEKLIIYNTFLWTKIDKKIFQGQI